MTEKTRDFPIASVNNLKALIKNIAQCDANYIINSSEHNEENYRFRADDGTATWLESLDLFEALNKATIKEQIKTLDDSLRNALVGTVLVKDLGFKKLIPLAYETLSLIFLQTDESFRQEYFHELIEFYYKELSSKVGGNDLVPKRPHFNKQIKLLLPIVKFEALRKLIKDGGNKQLVTELVKNISNYFNHPRVNQEDIYAVLKNKFNSNHFKLICYELIAFKQRNGHLGDYFHLKIQVKRDGIVEHLNLFAKFVVAPVPEVQKFLEQGPCKKEDFFYMIFLPKLKELGLTDLLDFAPNCYFSRPDDVLILDDMNASGFVGPSPNTRLGYEELQLALKQLAKFHACSLLVEEFLTKQNQKNVFLNNIYEEYLQEIVFDPDSDMMKQMIQVTIKNILFFSSQFPEIAHKYSEEQLKEKAENGWKIAHEKIKTSNKYKNVICHGDLYVANVLFNFNEDKKCQAVAIIDYQMLRYCPPAQDLVFFLHQNAFKETLDIHKSQLLNEYYDSLSNYLAKYNINIDETYPRNMFDESIKYMKSQAIISTLLYSPMIMIDAKQRERIFQDPEEFKKIMNDPLATIKVGMQGENYRKQIKGLMEEFIDLCDNGDI